MTTQQQEKRERIMAAGQAMREAGLFADSDALTAEQRIFVDKVLEDLSPDERYGAWLEAQTSE